MSTQCPKQNMVVFLDIDGVIAEITNRLKYVEGEEKEYDKFYGACMADDEPMYHNIDLFYALLKTIKYDMKNYIACHVVALTGRPKRTETLTKMWMEKNCPELSSFIDEWTFRADKDWQKACTLKAQKAENIVRKMSNLWGYDGDNWVIVIIDDDPTNVAAINSRINRAFGYYTIPLTVGVRQFIKLMQPPAFACKCSNGCENCTSCEEGCEHRSSHQCQK